ncbi:hypothetical protein B0H19DRAFT_1171921 [Mycena capillaripes]|nr:hypothetical protein B0H19DRAFT_1171921 [Mycena capillaripes]
MLSASFFLTVLATSLLTANAVPVPQMVSTIITTPSPDFQCAAGDSAGSLLGSAVSLLESIQTDDQNIASQIAAVKGILETTAKIGDEVIQSCQNAGLINGDNNNNATNNANNNGQNNNNSNENQNQDSNSNNVKLFVHVRGTPVSNPRSSDRSSDPTPGSSDPTPGQTSAILRRSPRRAKPHLDGSPHSAWHSACDRARDHCRSLRHQQTMRNP